MPSPFAVYAALLVTIVTWSHAFVAIKYCLRSVTPWELLLLRHVPASITFVIYLLLFRARTEIIQILREDGVRFLILGAVAVTGYHLSLNIGSQDIPGGTVSLVVGMSPVFTFLFAAVLINERPTRVQILGVAVAFVGLFVCVRYGGGKELGAAYLVNALILLLSPVFGSLHTTLSRPLSQKHGALNTTALTIILGTAPLLFGISPELLRKIPTLSASFWAADLLLSLGCTATAYLLWTFALGHLEATKVAVFLYFIPVLGVLWGWLYLDETITSWLLLGAALIISGVVLTNRQKGSPSTAPPR